MRIWLDPDKMLGLNLTAADVNAAITAQNAQVAAGSIGAQPNPITQQICATVLVKGQLTIRRRVRCDRASRQPRRLVRASARCRAHRDRRRETIASRPASNGKPSAAFGVQLSPTGNALATSERRSRRAWTNWRSSSRQGVEYSVPYDTSPFVKVSIEKVLHTLLEAVVLVFIVMFLFLQNIRYTIIPTLVVPVALLGTCRGHAGHGLLDQRADHVRAWCWRSAFSSTMRSSSSRTSSASWPRRACRRRKRPARR